MRAPDLALLMAADGQSGEQASPPYPADAIERRQRSLSQLAGMTPNPPASMPPSLGAAEAVLRPAPVVLCRALGLFCVAAQGAAIGNGGESVLPAMRRNNPAGIGSLTPREKAFLETDNVAPHAAIQMSWRFEALNLLLWALSLNPAPLGPASETANTEALSRRMMEIAQDKTAIEKCALRPTPEILDLLDLTWRQHWIVREAGRKEIAIDGLDPDVVMERHFALNWLTGFQNDRRAEWDDIDTPT